jgi:hypothetical protein
MKNKSTMWILAALVAAKSAGMGKLFGRSASVR